MVLYIPELIKRDLVSCPLSSGSVLSSENKGLIDTDLWV